MAAGEGIRELICRAVDGECSEAEREELREALEANPELAAEVFSAAEERASLVEVLAGPAEGASGPRRASAANVRAAGPRRKSRPRRRRPRTSPWVRWGLVPAAAAASLLLAAHFVNVWNFERAQKALCAEVIELGGPVEIVTEKGKAPAALGAKVKPGTTLATSPGATVRLRYPDGTTLEVKAATDLSIRKHEKAKRIYLQSGEFSADVSRQPAGAPMIVSTPQAESRVIGTRFKLKAGAGKTRLEVTSGRVRMTRAWDGAFVDVPAGCYAVAGRGLELTVLPIPGPAVAVKVPAPAPVPSPAPAEMSVTSLTLMNAEAGRPVPGFDPLRDGAVLNLAKLPTRKLSIRANVSGPGIGSVQFGLDGDSKFYTERAEPYFLAGDERANFPKGWTPSVGRHAVTATPYSGGPRGGPGSHGQGATGRPGKGLTVSFRVIDE